MLVNDTFISIEDSGAGWTGGTPERERALGGGYFNVGRALSGGGVFDRFIAAPGATTFGAIEKSWPVWLGVVGVGVAFVVLTKGKK